MPHSSPSLRAGFPAANNAMKDKILKEAEGILNMIELGDTVRDTITGFTGKATGRREWLGQKPQIMVEATRLDSDGLPYAELWFAEGRLEKVLTT